MCTRLQNEKSLKIDQIQSDHDKEFENAYMESFRTRSGISLEFSAPTTPQQNGVVERKNRVIQEMARAMLHNKDVWLEICGEKQSTPHVIRLTGYISNPIQRRLPMNCGREESQM